MAFWNKSLAQKHHVIEVITYDGPSDVLVWKHPGEDFNTNTQLVVGLAQEAVFVKGGQVLEHFMPGRYTLSAKNYPFVRALVGLVSDSVSSFSCGVYYVNKGIAMGIDWGTDTLISVVDPIYRVPVDVGSYGDFSLQVENSQKLMEKLVGQSSGFSHQEIQQFFTNMMAMQVRGVISGTMLERQLSPIGIDAHLPEMSAAAAEKVRPIFEPYGMSVVHFTIAAITALELDTIKQKARDLQEHRMERDVSAEDKKKFAQAQAFENRELNVTEQQKWVAQIGQTLAGNIGPVVGGGAGMPFPGMVGGNIVQPAVAGTADIARMLMNQPEQPALQQKDDIFSQTDVAGEEALVNESSYEGKRDATADSDAANQEGFISNDFLDELTYEDVDENLDELKTFIEQSMQADEENAPDKSEAASGELAHFEPIFGEADALNQPETENKEAIISEAEREYSRLINEIMDEAEPILASQADYEPFEACDRHERVRDMTTGPKLNTPAVANRVSNPTIEQSSVAFSAVAPKRLAHSESAIINLVIYEKESRHIVDEMLEDEDDPAKEHHGSALMLSKGDHLLVNLRASQIDLDVTEPVQVWNGKHLVFSFPVLIPDDYPQHSVLFTAYVYINEVIATRLTFKVKCEATESTDIEVQRHDVQSAFVSYSSRDRASVASRLQGIRSARRDLDVFFDVSSIHSGERWENVLKQEIMKRDVLFLFWSENAKSSEWVEREWRYALENKGMDAIWPIPLVRPEQCSPPEELKQLHFNDVLLYVISADAGKSEL